MLGFGCCVLTLWFLLWLRYLWWFGVLSAYGLLIVLSYLHLFDFVFSGGCFNDFAVVSGLLVALFMVVCLFAVVV